MSWGGKRTRAGRPKGGISLSTRAILESMNSGGEMPIAYMLRVMRNEKAPDLRRDEMAKAAAAYLHPRIAALPEDPEEAEESEQSPPAPESNTGKEDLQ